MENSIITINSILLQFDQTSIMAFVEINIKLLLLFVCVPVSCNCKIPRGNS